MRAQPTARAPLAWLLWALAVLVAAYTTCNPLYLILTLAALWGVGESVGQPPTLRLLLPLIGLATLWNFLSVRVGETVLFSLPSDWFLIGGNYTVEAALFGALNGLALGIILSAFAILVTVLSPRDLARLTPPALYEAGLVLSVALAFFPQGRETLEEIRQAQAIRGHRVRGVRDLPPLLLPLLITALERALQLAEALEARGFTARRTSVPPLARALLLAGLLLLIVGAGGALLGLSSVVGGALLLAGCGAILAGLWLIGRGAPRMAYRSQRAGFRDWLPAGAVLAVAAWWLGSALVPGWLRYEVYPRIQAPEFDLAAALPLLLLALPAWVGSGPVAAEADAAAAIVSALPVPPTDVPTITFEQLTFAYPEAAPLVLADINVQIAPGAFVVVTGPSGSGKSTLLRCINGLAPATTGGEIAGHVWVGARDAPRVGPQQMATQVGYVIQSPEAGFVADMVDDELVFALELAGLSETEITERLESISAALGIAALRGRPLARLSGGERQRVALAAALVLHPPILLLDEPLSQLDPQEAQRVLALLEQLHQQGLTIVVTEHRLGRLLSLATQVLYLPGAGAVLALSPQEAAAQLDAPPAVVALGRALGWEPLPLSLAAARKRAAALPLALSPLPAAPAQEETAAVLEVRELAVAYNGATALRDISLTVGRGELVGVLGINGAGKTTLLRAIAGLLPLQAGRIRLNGEEITAWPLARRARRVGYLPQEPDLLLFAETVAEELRVTLRNHGLPENGQVPALLAELGLSAYADSYPRDLSVGERQRVALGAVTIPPLDVLLLDEPTRGLDRALKLRLGTLLQTWCAAGLSVLLVTHDVEWAVEFVTWVLVLEAGRVRAEGDPHQILPADPVFAPQMAQLFPESGVLTVAEVLQRRVVL